MLSFHRTFYFLFLKKFHYFSLKKDNFLHFSMSYRLDRNRNGGGITIYVRKDIPTKVLTKHNLPEDIEGIFLEINFRKSKWLLCRTYHLSSQNDQYFFDNIDKTLDIYCSYEKIVLADFNAQERERLLDTFLH